MGLTLDNKVVELSRLGIAGISAAAAWKLAAALKKSAGRAEPEEVTVGDLLGYLPMRYEDRSNFLPLDQLRPGMTAAAELFVRNAGAIRVGKNRDPRKPPLYLFEVIAGDAEKRFRPVKIKWFISGKQAPHIIEWQTARFKRGTRFVAHGKWEAGSSGVVLMIQKPDELEILPSPDEVEMLTADDTDDNISDPSLASVHTGRVPVYRKLGTFQTKRIREIMHSVIAELDEVTDPLPADIRSRANLISAAAALRDIHFPPVDAKLDEYEAMRSPAHERLIFDEFFWLSFSMQLLRGERLREPKAAAIEITDSIRNDLKRILPFRLTAAQKRVIGEIFADLKSDKPMNRLVQGDVGSGKTIVAFLAMLAVVENGYQAALMAPTEILAEQHFRNAQQFLGGLDFRIELLTGSVRSAAKRNLREAVAAGDADLVIGTHALISDAVKFDRLGIAVIDEQHRFGVMQRAALKALGSNPDILVMTATPIPRSLAMTVYGDLDVSIIDEMPPGRTPIKTVVVGEDQRRGVYKGIERELKQGRQVYVVCPLVEESEKVDLKAAVATFEDLRDRVFLHRRVGLVHGKMKPAEKETVMSAFVSGELDILVSTTVIEVGVDVANASLMVIEHAERFGLSQLHQLRGRVGRGSDQSYCVLMTSDKKTAVARERLGIMEETSDGFKIAEKDLEIRGQGEILGTRQSGLETFKVANLVRDMDILLVARSLAEEYLTKRRHSAETKPMVRYATTSSQFRLGKIG
ncbi:MAG: ATP-dependent DNA helicase RecG [Acidobacteria bacterium]|nr:ATP-dependent DNA helicase RecG [Acidobacteriota bacterium]